MAKDNRKIRIKDIAEMAGVSVGTVDRVIHNRGKVSAEVEKEIRRLLKETGYTPNPIAQSLGSKKDFTVAVIIPRPEQDEYWKLANAGINEAQKKWKSYDFHINLKKFDLYNADSFVEVSERVLDSKPDAVLTAPIFYDESVIFFQKLRDANIPYVLFNTQMEKDDPLCFIGQNLYQSGRLAAEMMDLTLQEPAQIAVMHIHENIDNSIHLKNKERGFRDYCKENRSDFKIHTFSFFNNKECFDSKANKYIKNNHLNGIFVTTSSGVSVTAEALVRHDEKSIALIGYDLLKPNIDYLKNRVINFLINQDPRRQAFQGLRHLADHLLFNISPPDCDLLPLEIITRENYDSFLKQSSY